VFSRDELMQLSAIAEKYDMLILSDEIHSDLIFKPHVHVPLASLSEAIADRTITTMAPSKTFNLAGFSTAAVVISNEEIRKKFEKILDTIHIGMGNVFGNIAFETAYNKGEEWLEQLLVYLQANVKTVSDFISNYLPQIKVVQPEATYMIWLDCRELGMGSKELNKFMIDDAGLAMNDGAMFGPGGDGYMRMNVACAAPIVKQALENLKNAIEKLKR